MGMRSKPEVKELLLHMDCGIRGWERINPVVLPFPGCDGG